MLTIVPPQSTMVQGMRFHAVLHEINLNHRYLLVKTSMSELHQYIRQLTERGELDAGMTMQVTEATEPMLAFVVRHYPRDIAVYCKLDRHAGTGVLYRRIRDKICTYSAHRLEAQLDEILQAAGWQPVLLFHGETPEERFRQVESAIFSDEHAVRELTHTLQQVHEIELHEDYL